MPKGDAKIRRPALDPDMGAEPAATITLTICRNGSYRDSPRCRGNLVISVYLETGDNIIRQKMTLLALSSRVVC